MGHLRKFSHITLFFDPLSNRILWWLPQKTIVFHEFPCHPLTHGEDGIKNRGIKQDPDRDIPKSGFIQAPAFIEKRDPARGRADIPPGGARSRTPRRAGRGRRIRQWQQLDPPFSVQRLGFFRAHQMKRQAGQ
jgi:hypothetical protein